MLGRRWCALRAREVFEAARGAARRLEEIERAMGDIPFMGGHAMRGGGSVGDPTSRDAAVLCDLEAERASCEGVVGEALRLIEGVRKTIETPWWRVLEGRYVDGLSWEDVADDLGITERTCMRWRDAACEWVDAVGFARASIGSGVAEM